MKNVSAEEVRKQLEAGFLLHVIDVRETSEVAAGRIPGAVNIPLGLVEFRKQELDKDKEYVLVCRSGGRSGRAAEYLDSFGYRVINMAGGMAEWDGPTE
ncbi:MULTISPECIES: rhodanese-like domain-containing protein [unclassified Paenibacillus]|uniref:rhodanese-like domain-containing protein n=1 Tax=unclassified Paenibacillus TaxID=185978 RepID=UPI000954704A|nr:MULTISPECIES: rhodanese-like domain-containing protein [unclassified Paenibacillus]ASS67942.1 rhodanese-like domain-containing protein [Paenibacillus sp. RUD330]SIR43326.1 Rhodanese-related sulfurtransferase [Paenibacillus sp. RU4X]SIR53302.1 Rhodanese-related sulfurtransferase [Paenibacillus sp. RU4T]